MIASQVRRRQSEAVRTWIYHGGVVGFGFVMLYPLLWMLAGSFKPADQIFSGNVLSLIPARPIVDNYIQGWAGFGGISFLTFFRNTLLYAGVGTVLVVSASALTAYGFARLRFTGRKLWFTFMLITLMLPIQVQVVPEYILFSKLGMVNTFWPLLLPRIGGQAFFIFMIMQFIRGIPRELDDAAAIDGCSEFGVFWRVIVPLISPALVTAAIFSFYFTWGDFLTPLIYLNDPKLYTISVALRTFADPSSVTNWGAIFAMGTLALVPVFAVFIFFQRYLVEGISTAGLSGR
ncbi:MAG TPA: carbohydrate ABC transporter permease [Chloroflexota bacterium]|jgi:multiple sugar transport system permease protein